MRACLYLFGMWRRRLLTRQASSSGGHPCQQSWMNYFKTYSFQFLNVTMQFLTSEMGRSRETYWEDQVAASARFPKRYVSAQDKQEQIGRRVSTTCSLLCKSLYRRHERTSALPKGTSPYVDIADAAHHMLLWLLYINTYTVDSYVGSVGVDVDDIHMHIYFYDLYAQ